MKLDSKYFDSIRVKPSADRLRTQQVHMCDWAGCQQEGSHRAPKGRGREGEFHMFCLDHVRDYNKSYNYFTGMSDDAVVDYQKSAATGHRPTWSSAANAWTDQTARARSARGRSKVGSEDPFNLFPDAVHRARQEQPKDHRPIRNAERKAFAALDLSIESSGEDIKSRFKLLVKRHHPDSNGGDRSNEDRLREIIQAYNYLKKVGFC